ncbi:hypothetical protein WJX82_010035 [Trebouxia sp. C0006]
MVHDATMKRPEFPRAHGTLSHAGSSNNLSPSTSTSLSRFSSSDFTISPGAQLTSPIASGLSINSSTTNHRFPYFGSPSQQITSSARQLGSPNHHVGNHTQQLGMAAYPASPVDAGRGYRGPNPMAGHQWLPQNPSLASHLGQMRNEKQKSRPTPLDFSDGLWGFDEFPPVPATLCQGQFLLELHSTWEWHEPLRVVTKRSSNCSAM